MDNRPRCTYKADVRECLGKLVGPNGFGEMLAIEEVRWDGEKSLVFFRHVTVQDQ